MAWPTNFCRCPDCSDTGLVQLDSVSVEYLVVLRGASGMTDVRWRSAITVKRRRRAAG
ncbi:hypothetical protein M6B38_317590 [Iris pallida]|uniref:Uncharacterized protein n=1 Tax=Iris pallida TaxID=29817 RepID=A0AAX6DQ94_IRIPA|nr:hypothetical protein M6B38_233130 [Iris pallida]KAJ6838899.1 hypothetical protein M6B38_317590 [Iris pallida]